MVVSVFATLLLSIACRQLPSVLCLFLIFFAVAVFFVPPRSGGVGFACLLLRCVREPWFPWVSCARRVVCSGAGRAFLLRCLGRYFVRWRSLSLCVGRFCFWFCRAGVSSVCSGLVRVPALVGALRPLPWWVSLCRALASSVWSLLGCVCCRPVFDHCRFECLSAMRSVSRFCSLRGILAAVFPWGWGAF